MISLSLPSNNLNFVRLLEISCFYGVTGNEHSPEMGQVTRRTKLVLFWENISLPRMEYLAQSAAIRIRILSFL